MIKLVLWYLSSVPFVSSVSRLFFVNRFFRSSVLGEKKTNFSLDFLVGIP